MKLTTRAFLECVECGKELGGVIIYEQKFEDFSYPHNTICLKCYYKDEDKHESITVTTKDKKK